MPGTSDKQTIIEDENYALLAEVLVEKNRETVYDLRIEDFERLLRHEKECIFGKESKDTMVNSEDLVEDEDDFFD